MDKENELLCDMIEKVNQIIKNSVVVFNNLYKKIHSSNWISNHSSNLKHSGYTIFLLLVSSVVHYEFYDLKRKIILPCNQYIQYNQCWHKLLDDEKQFFKTLAHISNTIPLNFEINDQNILSFSLETKALKNELDKLQVVSLNLKKLGFPLDIIIKIYDYNNILSQFIPYHLKWDRIKAKNI
jgi:hypothetical protein